MSSGPIEFLSDIPSQEVPDTELGGADGLIQPRKPELLKGDPLASGGHRLDAEGSAVREVVSESSAVVSRHGMRTLSSMEGWTGEEDPGWSAAAIADGMPADAIVDPLTGRAVHPDLNKQGGTPGELSDLKP